MENYKPNSHKYKEKQAEANTEKKVEKIITGTANTKKKGSVRKFTDVFALEDSNTVKNYVISDVIIPLVKKGITATIDMFLYGADSKAQRGSTTAHKVSYQKFYDKSNEPRTYVPARSTFNYDDIIIDNRGEAEAVLYRMTELVQEYGMVSIADLYDLCGITTDNYMYHKYGWTDVRGSSVARERDGYVIRMPKAVPLN